MAIDTLAVKRRLLTGLRLTRVVPEWGTVGPRADLAGFLRHSAAVQPKPQAQRGIIGTVKHSSLDSFGHRCSSLGIRNRGRDLINTGICLSPIQFIRCLTVHSDQLIVFEKLNLGDGRRSGRHLSRQPSGFARLDRDVARRLYERNRCALQNLNRHLLGLDGLPMPIGHCRSDLVFASLDPFPCEVIRRLGYPANRFAIGEKVNMPHLAVCRIVAGVGLERNRRGRHELRPCHRRRQLDRRRMVHGEKHLFSGNFVLVVLYIHCELSPHRFGSINPWNRK